MLLTVSGTATKIVTRSTVFLSTAQMHCVCSVMLFIMMLGLSDASHAQSPVKVAVAEAKQTDLVQEVPLTGSVTSPRQSVLSVEVAGLVKDVAVDAGDVVAQGDILMTLDPELTAIAVESARAAVDSANQSYAESKRLLDEAQALARQNNIADSEVQARAAQSRIDAAAVKVAEAQLHQRQAELARHQLKAPFAGTISRRLVEVGQWVTPGGAAFELVDTQDLRLDFRAPQRYFPQIRSNTQLTVRFDAHPEHQYAAVVHRKVPASTDNARTFLLRAHLSDEQTPLIIPGMSVDGTLKLDLQRRGVTVPRDALIRYPDGRVSVWVLERGDGDKASVREQFVEVGLLFGNRAEVRSGLDAGLKVVTQGNEALRDGQDVEVVQPSGGEQ